MVTFILDFKSSSLIIFPEKPTSEHKQSEELKKRHERTRETLRKKLKKGDNIVLAAFGGGFTWGSVYLKWAY